MKRFMLALLALLLASGLCLGALSEELTALPAYADAGAEAVAAAEADDAGEDMDDVDEDGDWDDEDEDEDDEAQGEDTGTAPGAVTATKTTTRTKTTTTTRTTTANKAAKTVNLKARKKAGKLKLAVKDQVYTGKALKPAVTVKLNGKALKKNKDYKSKKTYYVRVRAYVALKGGKYYSAWSAVKSAKIK